MHCSQCKNRETHYISNGPYWEAISWLTVAIVLHLKHEFPHVSDERAVNQSFKS